MKRFFICLSLVLLTLAIVSQALAQATQDIPRVWEAPLVIPTYELNSPNPYPALLDWQRRKWRPVYPYPFLDSLGTEKNDKAWKAVYLENEYLKVTVLPELGGHVYQIFDKTLNRNLIYSNPVMKYAMVALRGAWVSGGIEWNFPDGHTLTTVAPVDYVYRTEADGSAAVAVGDTERVQGMQWQVILRLRPGTRVLESEVTLNNRAWCRDATGTGPPPVLRPHPIYALTIRCVKLTRTRSGRSSSSRSKKALILAGSARCQTFFPCLHASPNETTSAFITRNLTGEWFTLQTIESYQARKRGRGALTITATSGSIS
jgi:hypothetical protein